MRYTLALRRRMGKDRGQAARAGRSGRGHPDGVRGWRFAVGERVLEASGLAHTPLSCNLRFSGSGEPPR
jgi:hypothetical protein